MRMKRQPWIEVVLLGALCLLSGCKDGGGADSSGSKPKSDASQSSGGKGSQNKGGSDSKAGGADTTSEDTGSSDKEASVPEDTVKIAPGDQGNSGIAVAPVEVRRMPQTLNVAGQVALDERHTDHIGAIADGRIERVFVLPGDPVHTGQTLALLHSHSVHETVGALAQAFAAVERQRSGVTFATEARDRYARLYSIKAASLEEAQRAEQQLKQAQLDLADAEANVRMEREHLSELLQVQPESLTPATIYNRELVPVRAVASGVVIARSVTPGQVVNTGDEAFVTSNLRSVWVTASVNERDLPNVHSGAGAQVTLQGRPQPFVGRVAMLGDVLDPQTRTVPVRVSVPNPGIALRPGMFVAAAIAEPATRDAIFVPQEALQNINGIRVVFVTPDGTNFQARAVTAGTTAGDRVEIMQGLRPGEHIVTHGAFMVKSQLLKGTVGEG